MIRDYRPEDLAEVQRIHAENGIAYTLPDLSSPLWIVTKVAEKEGKLRAALGCWLQAELYLQLDKSDWGTPQEKLQVLQDLDKAAMEDLYWLKGIEHAVLWLPPQTKSFGRRLVKNLGFMPTTPGWITYSKLTRGTDENHN